MSGRIPSRAKSKEAIDEYMEDLRDFIERRDSNKGFDQTIQQFRVVERKNRAQLTAADFAEIYRDEQRHIEWVKLQQKYAEAELQHHLDMIKPSRAFLDKIEEKGQLVKERKGVAGTTDVDLTAKSESVLRKIQKILDDFPDVRARLLETPPEAQADFDLRMRKSMDAIRSYVENEAVNDFKAQCSTEVLYQQLRAKFESESAPKLAYEKELLERKIQEMQGQVEKNLSRELDELSVQSQEAETHEDASRKAQAAAQKQSELESKATRIQGDLNAARRNAESERQQFDHKLQAQKAQCSTLSSELQECRQELAKARGKLDSGTESGKDAENLQQAVAAFARYCLGASSAVIPPSVEQMQTLQSQCYESPFSEGIAGLPAIVIPSGQMPAAWSYLSLASAGVLMNSRFNQTMISPAVCSELPWIHDTLARVVNAVSKEPMTVELQRTLIVLLQGIAYVHLAAPLWTKKPLMPEPSVLLASLAHIEQGDGSVLGMIHQQVYKLVHHGTQFRSWVREGFTGEMLNATNSALPQDVALIHRDTPGTIFLAHSSVGIFIIDEQELNADLGFLSAKLRMPPGVPEDMRQMDLATDEHGEALKWVLSTYRR